MVTVIKVGGAIVEHPESLSGLLDGVATLNGSCVLVHGGGRSATQVATQLGIESKMIGGRRVTDPEMLRIVTMVYGGLVNKNIVAQLQARGVTALGLTGADVNLIRAHRRPVTAEGIDFGLVGDVDGADGERLMSFISAGIMPVVAPLTHDGAGQILNTNADTIASTVATALAPLTDVTLTFCFELPGVMRDPSDAESLIPAINEASFRQLLADGVVSGGMIPKLENAFRALHAGVKRVVITRADALQGGTVLTLE